MKDVNDVYIFPDEHGCAKCSRFVCNLSRISRFWHLMTRWHRTGYVFRDARISISGLYSDGVQFEIRTGPAQPAE